MRIARKRAEVLAYAPKRSHKISVPIKSKEEWFWHDMQNQEKITALEDFAAYIRNPVFMQFGLVN